MNNYERPNLLDVGRAYDLILGQKPMGGTDTEGSLTRQERVDDVDETDE